MRLLITTQKVNKNDPVLGFFHDWIIEFSKNVESLLVVCLEEGEHNLPDNVQVVSLGKEKGYSKLRIIWNFLKVILSQKYDKVFVHMNPEYVMLAGWFWRLKRKRIFLWYTHKAVNLKLKTAVFFANTIFSASKESFRYKTSKLQVMGHGIDASVFYSSQNWNSKNIILSVGRISKTKNYEPLIEAVADIKKNRNDFKLIIAGGPVTTSDQVYFENLQRFVVEKGVEQHVQFLGPISYERVPELYRNGNIFVNLSNTGSVDKVVLEAMASGLHIVTSNEAFQEILQQNNLTSNNPKEISQKIVSFFDSSIDKEAIDYVRNNHSLKELIARITEKIKPQRVCMFGFFDENYSRNTIIRDGFLENGYDVVVCNIDPRSQKGFMKYVQLYNKWRSLQDKDFEKIFVCFPGQITVLFSLLFIPKNKIVFDFFASLFNSDIEDRKTNSKFSFRAWYLWLLDFFSLHTGVSILIDTKAHRDFISSKFFVKRTKFHILYVGSNPNIVFPKNSEGDNQKFVVHFHGTNTPMQGFRVIFKAAELLRKEKDIEFRVYGFSGTDTENLRFLKRFPYSQMSDVLATSDVVLGIFGDTKKAQKVIPNKVFEGLAARKLVITQQSRATSELFRGSGVVVLCKEADPQDLAQKIIFYKNNPSKVYEISQRGYEYFVKNMTPKILIKNLIDKI